MKRIFGLLLVVLLMLPAVAMANDVKIGYVDLQKALNLSEAGQAAKGKIAEKVKDYQGTIESRQAELKNLKDELEKKELLLSEEARSEKERDYQQKLKDFQRFTKDVQDELQQKDADYTKSILEEIFKVIQEVSEKGGYTLVLEKTESSILYAADQIDLTNAVIEAYDARHQKDEGN